MAEYRLSPAAERDLEHIVTYTRDQWGADQASRYMDRLFAAFDELARAPKSAPACDHIRPGYRRRGVERHVIYFRVMPYGVAIVRILHEHMDAGRHIESGDCP
ncbi:type II toxin-antitoxin system RelE/ParE family toxin [Methylocella sp.]|uniref:type II toxin-antitoxin system RelE/ParE family toxin n=1 Tax=Methylocella sp. TaxID=1978226 RepID=UPI0035B24A1D